MSLFDRELQLDSNAESRSSTLITLSMLFLTAVHSTLLLAGSALASSVRRVAPYSHWVGVLYGLTDGELNSE